MPFASNSELPKSVRDALPKDAQDVFRAVANRELDQGATEQSAIAQAWTAVKNGWEKNDEGEWVRKQILKFNDEQRIVYGWASVIKENGEVVVDTQGDVIEPEELEKATAEFMLNVRRSQAMHKGGQIGTVVHSFPLTEQIADSLDILSDKEGWIVGVKIDDDHIWEDVKSGKLRAFSIGGKGMREEI